jgi:MazG family protein
VNCPWDQAQTARSLIPHLLEETHEVVDAIRAGDDDELEGELGDLLLNLAFQIVVAEEGGTLSTASVVERLEAKMVRRHPHLFSDVERQDWETLKAGERAPESGVLDGLASGIDPLLKAYRMQDRAAGVGFDWPDARGALDKVREELDEVSEVLPGRRKDDTPPDPDGPLAEEIGDLLFAVVNLARLAGIHPDTALDDANRKFQARFESVEALARERGLAMPGSDLEALDALWNEVKAGER